MGPQDPADVTRDVARDLSDLVGELATLKWDANHWLTDPEYAPLKHRLEDAGAVLYPMCTAEKLLHVEVALV
jgi:hypothetical protein